MPYTRPTLDYVLRRLAALLALAAVSSCSSGDTVLLKVTADGPVDKFKIYIRNNVPDATGKKQFVFATPDWTDATKMGTVMINDGEHGIGVKLPGPGDYSIVLLGMKGRVTCLDPQHDDLAMPPGDGGLMEEYGSGVAYFWAATGSYMGNEELPARMFEVKHAAGMNEDQDCDSFPDVNTWPVRLGGQVATIPTTLLDCNDQKQAIQPLRAGAVRSGGWTRTATGSCRRRCARTRTGTGIPTTATAPAWTRPSITPTPWTGIRSWPTAAGTRSTRRTRGRVGCRATTPGSPTRGCPSVR